MKNKDTLLHKYEADVGDAGNSNFLFLEVLIDIRDSLMEIETNILKISNQLKDDDAKALLNLVNL